MSNTEKRRQQTKILVLGAIFTALVIVLQLMGSFIRFGIFSISLVLIPIVLGAATCGVKIGAWLGFVFGAIVLISGDAAPFMAIDVFGTIITVMVKGIGCGLLSGLVYKLVEKYNRYVAVIAAAIVCPIVNTGIFLLGCSIFFLETISQWGVSAGFNNAVAYMFLGLAGGNFLFELATNIILSPVIVRVLNIKKKNITINKREIAVCILLSIVTLGIYQIYWTYLLVKNIRIIKGDTSSCIVELLCLVFVPFYSLYWWFTRGKIVKKYFDESGYSANSNENIYLILGVFGLSIVSMAIMQNDFNSLPN